ncbi:peptidoglycan-binding domain-containing protein [Mesorhizobium carmichaelinearum]|uniref:peptidoglycan-binding domain-containing protein n=1 Tax=Mesorhizobium carmichaelinearum TaxID=1208188 RepID=UPI00117F236C|nr:peptidoglycan-binding protein [Mesorhizobium carmichaelinearum]
MLAAYQVDGLVLDGTQAGPSDAVRALQTDLRALGYLGRGIDGAFGPGSLRAVRALRYDLINNHGLSRSDDGPAPVAIADYNKGRITDIAAGFDQSLAACLADLISDSKVPKLPRSFDPLADNRAALAAVSSMTDATAPFPFILAMAVQESDSCHYCIPHGNDGDDFVSIGLDRNDKANPDRITSRGYGLGQYTIFHHPPRMEEIARFIVDPVGNVATAFAELRSKFDRDVVGPDSEADDRAAEHPVLALRLCRYPVSDKRRMADCQSCAANVPTVTIRRGTPLFQGSSKSCQPDNLYPSADYGAVPDRSAFLCDWPYAARRYNGSGLDSFHYQIRILLNLVRQRAASGDAK